MDLHADMVGDQPDDPFAVDGREDLAGVDQPLTDPIDPQPTVGIEHHLDDRDILEPARDGRSQRRTQHPRAALGRFGTEGMDRHVGAPLSQAGQGAAGQRG